MTRPYVNGGQETFATVRLQIKELMALSDEVAASPLPPGKARRLTLNEAIAQRIENAAWSNAPTPSPSEDNHG